MAETIGEKIKQIRSTYNLSQNRFGVKIGLTGKTISAYETGKCQPPLKVLDKISQMFNVSFAYTNDTTIKDTITALESQLNNLKSLLIDIK